MVKKKIFKYMRNKGSAGETAHPMKDGKGNLLSKGSDITQKKIVLLQCLKRVMEDSSKNKHKFHREKGEILRVIASEELK